MLTITPVACQIPNVLKETRKMFDGEVSIHGTKIEIIKEASYDALAVNHVLADTSRLAQIIINLVSNALKFMSSKRERRVSISYGAHHHRPNTLHTSLGQLEWLRSRNEPHENKMLPALEPGEQPLYLSFCVRDTGSGVKPEEIKNLFQRFSQANERTHITHGGSGLGLYICRELSETQGGAVGIVSKLEEGTIFGFYIEARHVVIRSGAIEKPRDGVALPSRPSRSQQTPPQKPEMADRGHDPRSPLDQTPDDAGPQADNRPSKWNVLLVEDNMINQRVLAKQLRNADCVVTTANHGQEALDIIEKTDSRRQARDVPNNKDAEITPPIDVVLMDLEMPIMGGLECTERIRAFELAHKPISRLPIIAITANVRQGQISQSLEAGMDNVMPKPFTVADLLERIRETVEAAKERPP